MNRLKALADTFEGSSATDLSLAAAKLAAVPSPAKAAKESAEVVRLRAETLVANLAACIEDGAVVATGVASPLAILAIAVAQATHAPNLTYLACVGALDPALTTLHRSSEELAYLEGRRAEVTIPDLFDHARRGRIDVVFFGAAEFDGSGATNMSAAGPLSSPTTKFPGLAGAASLRRWVKKPILVAPRQSKRTLVNRVQVASTSDPERVTRLLTDLGAFELGGRGRRARLVARNAWATLGEIRERTAFDYDIAHDLVVLEAPLRSTREAIRAIDVDGMCLGLVG